MSMGSLTPDVLWAGALGAVAGAVIGGVIGSSIPLWWAWRLRKIERGGAITAMHIELFRVVINLRMLIGDGVMAPLYRLPIGMTEQALPKLVGDGVLDGSEVYALVEYVNRVEELNRGLDRAGQAHASKDDPWLATEFARNLAKARELLDEKLERHGGRSVFHAAEAALFRLEGDDGDDEDGVWVWDLGQMHRLKKISE